MKYNIDQIRNNFKAGTKQKFLFFWGHQKSKNQEITQSCLSQWWPCEFVVDNVKYFSAEHYMMAEKAKLFNDTEMLEKIITAKSTSQAKQYYPPTK